MKSTIFTLRYDENKKAIDIYFIWLPYLQEWHAISRFPRRILVGIAIRFRTS